MDNNFNQNENAGNENNMAGYSTEQPNNQGTYNGAYNQQPNGNQAYGQNAYNNQQQQYGQPNYNQNMNGYNNQNMNGYNNNYTNGFAIAGLICGIASLFIFGIILGILGIIFSNIGQKNALMYTGRRSGMATGGMVCAIIGLVLGVVGIAACSASSVFLI